MTCRSHHGLSTVEKGGVYRHDRNEEGACEYNRKGPGIITGS